MADQPSELSWVRSHLGPEAQMGGPLVGGVTSQVHLIRIGGRRAVLKQVRDERWLAERPDVVGYEARVLDLLAATAIPVPRVLAVDETGVEAGSPSLLLSWIDGTPAGDSADPGRWLDQLVDIALRIAMVAPPVWVRPFERYLQAADAEPPLWAEDPAIWKDAIDAVGQPPPSAPERFIHRDYHPWNVLWNDALVGVVDWSQASVGPVAIDASHCRANLAIGFDAAVADAFRTRWEAATELRLDPYWDLVTCVDVLPDWRPSTRGTTSLEAWLSHLLQGSGG